MGCQVSVPHDEPINIGKTERRPRTIIGDGNVGGSKNLMSASNCSKDTNSRTVSLEVDEEIANEPPKLDQNGHLMAEEVVRRTSSSLCVSTATIGSKGIGGGELQLAVSTSRSSWLLVVFEVE